MLLSFCPNLCLEIGFRSKATNGWMGLHFDKPNAKLLFNLPLFDNLEILLDKFSKFLSVFLFDIALDIR